MGLSKRGGGRDASVGNSPSTRQVGVSVLGLIPLLIPLHCSERGFVKRPE